MLRNSSNPFLFWFSVLVLTAIMVAPVYGQDDDWDDDWAEDAGPPPVEVHGFVEGAGAARVVGDDAAGDDLVLGEARFRLDLSHFTDRATLSFKGDFVQDAVADETVLDIRQAWLSLRAASWLDVRAGNQVLTWGTGDLVFLNDMFPKDFVSFFVGREDEFLKAPSTAFKFSAYADAMNVDFVFTPVFAPDLYITGERLSFFDPMSGAVVAADSTGGMEAPKPARTLENAEYAARVHRNVSGYELAAYGYWGFSKQPRAYDASAGAPTFSRLAVVGASLRTNGLGGIVNLEGAYHVSRDDTDGDDPDIPNSEIRGLVGYERELVTNVTLGVQGYVEWVQDYETLLAASDNPEGEPEETRTMLTLRLTSRLMQETLILSLFGFVALEDGDTHWRPSLTRKFTDAVSLSLGANIMTGPQDTFFGQLNNNTNTYLRLRYSF